MSKIEIDRILHPKKKLQEWMICMICKGVVQEPQKCNKCDSCICAKCISKCILENSLAAKCSRCLNPNFLPLMDFEKLESLSQLKFKCFVCHCHDGKIPTYIPYDSVRVHDMQCKFKSAQKGPNFPKGNLKFEAEGQSSNEDLTKNNSHLEEIKPLDRIDFKIRRDPTYRLEKLKKREEKEEKFRAETTPEINEKNIIEEIECFLCKEKIGISIYKFNRAQEQLEPLKGKIKPHMVRSEIFKLHSMIECPEIYTTCHFCKLKSRRKHIEEHFQTTCAEKIVKCHNCGADFKEKSNLFKNHNCDDKSKELEFKSLIQKTLALKVQVDEISAEIKKIRTDKKKTKLSLQQKKEQIAILEKYMIDNKKALTDDEGDESSMEYREAFIYKKEHFCSITCYCVCAKGTDQFITCDEKCMIKLWNIENKKPCGEIDALKMMSTLYPLYLPNDSPEEAEEAQHQYKISAIQQCKSTTLCILMTVFRGENEEDGFIRDIFLCIQPDYGYGETTLNFNRIPLFNDVRDFIQNEDKVRRMIQLSTSSHTGKVTKMIDLKCQSSDFILTCDDQKTLIAWEVAQAKFNYLERFSEGLGDFEDIIEFRRKSSSFYGCVALAFADKRIAILEIKFKKSKKDASKVKVVPFLKKLINMINPPKSLIEVGNNQLVIVSIEFLYYYDQKEEKCLQPTSPSVHLFQAACQVSDHSNEGVVTVEGSKLLKLWDRNKSYEKKVHYKSSDKIIWLAKIPGRRAIVACNKNSSLRLLVAYK
ncbi:unnamed protein product [Moneuplotes crassus]|uniref:TRAF-type domain-containing protein n=1 Tax=Euplotes crassus TaxID=5936 RepID=A0AAD2DCH0_EUPCR|nr:unnamed protein product [Moneuplotes crassus]